MKNILSLVLLSVYSVCALAQSDLKRLDDLQGKIVSQSGKIAGAYLKYGLDPKEEPYPSLWSREFMASDQAEIFKTTVDLFRKIANKNDPLAKLQVERVATLVIIYCEASLMEFDEAKRSRKLPDDLLDQLDIQSANIRETCSYMKSLRPASEH